MRALLFFLLFTSAGYRTEAQQVPPGDWLTDCEENYCVYRKTLTVEASDATFALLEILIDTDSGQASIVMTVPLGVALEPGIRMIVEGREWATPLKVCYTDGCRATVEISTDDFGLLLQKKSIDIRYIPFSAENPISAILPLNGLVAAISRTQR